MVGSAEETMNLYGGPCATTIATSTAWRKTEAVVTAINHIGVRKL